MSITYLDPKLVTDVAERAPPLVYTRDGYGKKRPTWWMLRINNRWRRVYVIQYSNSGSAYVIVNRERHFLGAFDPIWWRNA